VHQRLAVLGAGYVGLVTAVGMASLGHRVTVVEIRPDRLSALLDGRVPIHEPDLQEAFDAARLAGRLDVSGEIPGGPVDQVLVCVGTPMDDEGRADLAQLAGALGALPAALTDGAVVVIRSTLPVGTSRSLLAWTGVPPERIVTNPEFLAQGTAYRDFLNPTRVVLGTFTSAGAAAAARVRAGLAGLDAPVLEVTVEEAELIKNAANAALALRLSFTNEIAGLCEAYGADVTHVMEGIGLDPRIGPRYLRASFGFGGSCLPKELRTLAAAGRARGLPMHVTEAASNANLASQDRFVERILELVRVVPDPRVAVLGLAFKADTDDVRASPAIHVVRRLIEAGCDVVAHDYAASANARREVPGLRTVESPEEAFDGADIVAIATEWPAYADLDWVGIQPRMRRPIVIDGRRILDPARIVAAGFRHEATGSPWARLAAPLATPAR